MALSKRERRIALATGLVIAAFALDRYIVSPLLDSESQLRTQIKERQDELDRAALLFKQRPALEAKWKQIVVGGMKQDAAETEYAIVHAMQEWSQDSRLTLSSIRPERPLTKTAPQQPSAASAKAGSTPAVTPQEITIQTIGTGNMSSVARFLYRLQTSPLPVKVVDMQLSTRREGTDDLSLQLRLSALYLPGTTKPAEKPGSEGSRP